MRGDILRAECRIRSIWNRRIASTCRYAVCIVDPTGGNAVDKSKEWSASILEARERDEHIDHHLLDNVIDRSAGDPSAEASSNVPYGKGLDLAEQCLDGRSLASDCLLYQLRGRAFVGPIGGRCGNRASIGRRRDAS